MVDLVAAYLLLAVGQMMSALGYIIMAHSSGP